MLKHFFIKCEHATQICDKKQYKEASFTEKLQLTLHNLFCKFCSKYVKQNRIITNILKIRASQQENNSLTKVDKEILRENFEKIRA